jgi:hypothetical protein
MGKTMQAAFLIVVTGITTGLLLGVLEATVQAISGQAAAWPVSITITATASYQATRRLRR